MFEYYEFYGKIETKKEHKVYVETLVRGEKPWYRCFLLSFDDNKDTKRKYLYATQA